jgi:hypothetical protein
LLTAAQVRKLLGAPGGHGTSTKQGTGVSSCAFSATVNGGNNVVQLDLTLGVTTDYFSQLTPPFGTPANGVGDKAYYMAATTAAGNYHFNGLTAQKGTVVVKLDAGGPLTAHQALPVLSADINAVFNQLGA